MKKEFENGWIWKFENGDALDRVCDSNDEIAAPADTGGFAMTGVDCSERYNGPTYCLTTAYLIFFLKKNLEFKNIVVF